MDIISRFFAMCGDGLMAAASMPLGLPAALFLAGLAGSLVHCVGMCGPFVLGQVMASAEQPGDRPYGEWHRLTGALLTPYHLGRFTTYTALGAVAGGVTAVFASLEMFGWLSAILLIAAAGLLAAQALGMAINAASPATNLVARLAGPLSASHTPVARYGLGVILGFLPCGLLYGALAAAAGTGSVVSGAIAMACFTLGTVPALVAVGWGGLIMRRQLKTVARWISPPLLAGNALVMLALASQRL
ncbi:sulfite exporter TauE/SafE family protein [Reyranella sp.]|uniref:sulfite exporter TauE/SafE family protein n=1 Tax=Reyranella sp. TaxID=1929291 RepID=UPI003BA9186A